MMRGVTFRSPLPVGSFGRRLSASPGSASALRFPQGQPPHSDLGSCPARGRIPSRQNEKVEVMIERSSRLPKLSLGPDALKRAANVFDQSWTAIAANFNDSQAENARTQLATIILGLSADGSRDAEQLRAAALEFVSRGPSPADLLH